MTASELELWMRSRPPLRSFTAVRSFATVLLLTVVSCDVPSVDIKLVPQPVASGAGGKGGSGPRGGAGGMRERGTAGAGAGGAGGKAGSGTGGNPSPPAKSTCGNGRIEGDETCEPDDAENPCPTRADCITQEACKPSVFIGDATKCTAQCQTQPILVAKAGDGCCPKGANAATDSDCTAPGCEPSWRSQTADAAFSGLDDPPPGYEDNSDTEVDQYVGRGRAPDGTYAFCKAVPSYGCYGTYLEGATRVGFGLTSFEVMTPNGECPLAWKPSAESPTPVDLAPTGSAAIHACRGIVSNEPYPDGKTASGTELGQWLPALDGGSGDMECWMQFHDGTSGLDRGSLHITDQVEVLTRAP